MVVNTNIINSFTNADLEHLEAFKNKISLLRENFSKIITLVDEATSSCFIRNTAGMSLCMLGYKPDELSDEFQTVKECKRVFRAIVNQAITSAAADCELIVGPRIGEEWRRDRWTFNIDVMIHNYLRHVLEERNIFLTKIEMGEGGIYKHLQYQRVKITIQHVTSLQSMCWEVVKEHNLVNESVPDNLITLMEDLGNQ